MENKREERQTDRDSVILVRKWNGDVDRARCKYCIHRSGSAPDDVRVPFFTCTLCHIHIGIMWFACKHFEPRPSFTVVSSMIQTSLFN